MKGCMMSIEVKVSKEGYSIHSNIGGVEVTQTVKWWRVIAEIVVASAACYFLAKADARRDGGEMLNRLVEKINAPIN
jgi:hypothetical protein